jgi:outer membrane protein OmpA-like peptidoglycan-associated protein
MKIFLLPVFLFVLIDGEAQYVGPPNNVGREYGNPKMPLVVSHLAGANKERLKRANKNSRHSVFGKVLCFRKLCRIQSGHPASLRAISFKKFRKKIARNAKRGAYKNLRTDSTNKPQPPMHKVIPTTVDTLRAKSTISPPVTNADSLIILSAELLFEINKSKLRNEHFETLNSIVNYLFLHPERSVKISGHSDNTGKEAHNVILSKQRAEVVAEYLISNGIDVSRVESIGLGSSHPIALNTTDEGREKNRRVELLIYDGQ